MLSFTNERLGIDKGVLDLSLLYPGPGDRNRFEDRWRSFVAEQSMNGVAWREGANQLCFLTESVVPTIVDDRPPLLIVLGNPAPHSVRSELPFSFEGPEGERAREHRFWIALRQTDFLEFGPDSEHLEGWRKQNQARKEALYSLSYASPFRLGIIAYFSMPSPASAPPWAGVDGLRKLFGASPLREIAEVEEERIRQIIVAFHRGAGGVLALQRDAYEGLRRPTDPPYSRVAALEGMLEARCKMDPAIPLIGAAPTRFMHAAGARAALSRARPRLMERRGWVRPVPLEP